MRDVTAMLVELTLIWKNGEERRGVLSGEDKESMERFKGEVILLC